MDHRKVDTYNAMKLNEYNDTFEIISGNESDDGTFYPTWAIVSEYSEEAGGGIPKKKDNGKFMVLPVKVVLGEREQAIANLNWLLTQLEAPTVTEKSSGEVPF